MRATRAIANFDSAAAMLRALARFLHGKDFPALGVARKARPLAPLLNALPEAAREQIYIWSGFGEALPPRKLRLVRSDEIARWVVGEYPRRRHGVALVGASNGAMVHLAAALGAPWLPQTFLVPVRHDGIDPDDPRAALEWGRERGRELLEANPDLQLHHMHDANQDRLMIQKMGYFRVKLRRLPEAYVRFLEESLEPGGTLIVLDCRRTWRTTRVGERHVFQHGALGGATDEEYLHGSARVEAFLRREGSSRTRWDAPEPDGTMPEAEWGFEPALVGDLGALARRRGWHVRVASFVEPEHMSPLVADLYRWWYGRRGSTSTRLLVGSFILLDPWWTLRTGSAPFWTKFPVDDDARALERYLDERAGLDELNLLLFSHGVESIGLVPLERWRAVLGRLERGRLLGVDEDAFPRDFAVFLRYRRAVSRIPARVPLPQPLSLAELDAFLGESGPRYDVSWS